ncbi:hypothetical protein [Azospirillum sp. TSH64]|uniref:hypothetical protein n=1 Tax=Azospirillum sp. TSH64 TaxID=652740 RepID=UPI000D60B543|nr:hypothetical protein [Azospirillum sp. TSH64]PWC81277.1 hypothetical protein TSH64_01160 [Azospirillum sp. TSH64]
MSTRPPSLLDQVEQLAAFLGKSSKPAPVPWQKPVCMICDKPNPPFGVGNKRLGQSEFWYCREHVPPELDAKLRANYERLDDITKAAIRRSERRRELGLVPVSKRGQK